MDLIRLDEMTWAWDQIWFVIRLKMTSFLDQTRVQSEGYRTQLQLLRQAASGLNVLFTFACLSATFSLVRVIMASPFSRSVWEPG